MLVLGAGSGPLQPPRGAAALGALPSWQQNLGKGGKPFLGWGPRCNQHCCTFMGPGAGPYSPNIPCSQLGAAPHALYWVNQRYL